MINFLKENIDDLRLKSHKKYKSHRVFKQSQLAFTLTSLVFLEGMSRFANIQMRVCPKSTTTNIIQLFFSKSYLSLLLIPEYFKRGTTGVMCRIIDQTKKRRKEIQLKINTANKVWKCYTARNLKLKC